MSVPQWNLFARELEDILAKREKPLSNLQHAGVYTEEIRRLRRSLLIPHSFPLLTPTQIEMVVQYYQLTHEEILRLRAAIVVTAIQRTLFRRISPDEALEASEEIYPIVLRAMQQNKLSSVRHDDDVALLLSAVEHPFDTLFDQALDALDRGVLALHESQLSRIHSERVRWAIEARHECGSAMTAFTQANQETQEDPLWQIWYQQAVTGQLAARKRLQELGVSDVAE